MIPGLVTLCAHFGVDYSDEAETAYELACITVEQVDRNPNDCLARMRAAMEDQ